MSDHEDEAGLAITVRIVQLGRGVFAWAGPGATPVGEALAAAGVPSEHMEVRVGGRRVELDAPLGNGDFVTVIPRIRGGVVRGVSRAGCDGRPGRRGRAPLLP